MLSQQENERLTRVGPGTPVGNLLRRYWQPVGASSLVTSKPQRVKALGEDLVLYRGASGEPVLMTLRCAHRGVALDHGRVEGDAIRCPYHGWLYGPTGQCLEQPTEMNVPKNIGIRLNSYKTKEVSGLVFAYLGPDPEPALPLFDMLTENGDKNIVILKVDVNWLQAVEQLADVAHFSWLHGYTFPRYAKTRPRYSFKRTDYGMECEIGPEDGPMDLYPFVMPGFIRFTLPPEKDGESPQEFMLRYLPRDDTSCDTFALISRASDKADAVDPKSIPASRTEAKFGEYIPLQTDWWGIDMGDQDRMAFEQQGVVADRTKENLVASDLGIVQFRRLLQECIEAVERGEDPVGVVRDATKPQFTLNTLFRTGRQKDAAYRPEV